ncbi:MAG: formate--tetrahydrofolate ligase [Candidatus Latescibacteria bacterium]|nr:formate--tetrahydrofolate ligase [Candidatus Latescibacterota bacterium]
MALPDIEIARKAQLRPINQIAEQLGIDEEYLEQYGPLKAKIGLDFVHAQDQRPPGKLVLVTSINPTPAGEGKTTTTVGLGDALNLIGKKAAVCLREPSLGPCFGIKGGAAGGGYAQVVPMEDINLHFTGDMHAITTAHNLLSATLDNHLHHGNALDIDPRRIVWKRVLDMNDRALRDIVIGLGGSGNSVPRESGFDITVASEVMAILCLSESLTELKNRLGRMIVGRSRTGATITAADLGVHGAMAVLLRDACKPNLVQTLEHTPAFIHGGPFANIAHGCNSVLATKLSLRLADYTVTEAGFGADLGAEKFLNIKCRQAGLKPDVVVLVATVRALKFHGGVDLKELGQVDMTALEKGLENLKKHLENIRRFGLPVVVAINSFSSDTAEEVELIRDKCAYLGAPIVAADHWARGGVGAEDLARAVVETADNTQSDFTFLYPKKRRLWDKVRTIAQEIYGADDIMGDKRLRATFRRLQREGYGDLPICMAKTQYSLSTDPGLKGRPSNFAVPIRDVRVAAGAGFVVVLAGDIMTMPGLPKTPSAEAIDFDENGQITGLF